MAEQRVALCRRDSHGRRVAVVRCAVDSSLDAIDGATLVPDVHSIRAAPVSHAFHSPLKQFLVGTFSLRPSPVRAKHHAPIPVSVCTDPNRPAPIVRGMIGTTNVEDV